MDALILYCGTGGGHKSAGYAEKNNARMMEAQRKNSYPDAAKRICEFAESLL